MVWKISAEVGTKVMIEFPKGTPFGNDRQGTPKGTFRASVAAEGQPAVIAAGPVQNWGHFTYEVRCTDQTGSVAVVDPEWDTPRA